MEFKKGQEILVRDVYNSTYRKLEFVNYINEKECVCKMKKSDVSEEQHIIVRIDEILNEKLTELAKDIIKKKDKAKEMHKSLRVLEMEINELESKFNKESRS